MIWLVIVIGTLLLCFGGVLLFGAPYLPTLTPQVAAALDLADLKPGDTLLELGCGDGKVLIAAAKQGVGAIGYELNPIIAVIAWVRTRRHRRLVHVIWGDFWRVDWPPAQAIFVFLLPKYMKKLDVRISRYKHRPVKLISFAFRIPDRKTDAQKQGVLLYHYKR